MAGVADRAFRILSRQYGAALVYTELVSANGLVRHNEKTRRLMRIMPEERPVGIQLFGNDPGAMAGAARMAVSEGPDLIDLNFGCPVRRVAARQQAGAGLLRDLPRMGEIVKNVISAVSLPVTGKIRSGWNTGHIVAVEAARILENEGASAVTVHARTRDMVFRGSADWSVIRDVRQAVSIPVIGNGDVITPDDAKRMLDETGCDLVMIGRGACGQPWIFHHINHYLETGELLPEPPFRERIRICLNHYDLALMHCSMDKAVREMRKHIGWYLKGMPGCAHVRREIFQMTDPEEVRNRLLRYMASVAQTSTI